MHRTGGPQAGPSERRRLGAAAELAAVHHMLRHGAVFQLKSGQAAAPDAGATRRGSVVTDWVPLQGMAVIQRRLDEGPDRGAANIVQLEARLAQHPAIPRSSGAHVKILHYCIVNFDDLADALAHIDSVKHDMAQSRENDDEAFEEQEFQGEDQGHEEAQEQAKQLSDEDILAWLNECSDLRDQGAVAAVRYATNLTKLSLDRIKGTTSGGLSLTLIPEGKDFVIQYFVPSTFRAIELMYDALQKAGPKLKEHVADIRGLVPELGIAIMERITPLNALFNMIGNDDKLRTLQDLKQYLLEHEGDLKAAGFAAIEGLAEIGVSQGDIQLDNMGLKEGKFALFDYDKARASSEATLSRDKASLERSFKFWTSRK